MEKTSQEELNVVGYKVKVKIPAQEVEVEVFEDLDPDPMFFESELKQNTEMALYNNGNPQFEMEILSFEPIRQKTLEDFFIGELKFSDIKDVYFSMLNLFGDVRVYGPVEITDYGLCSDDEGDMEIEIEFVDQQGKHNCCRGYLGTLKPLTREEFLRFKLETFSAREKCSFEELRGVLKGSEYPARTIL